MKTCELCKVPHKYNCPKAVLILRNMDKKGGSK